MKTLAFYTFAGLAPARSLNFVVCRTASGGGAARLALPVSLHLTGRQNFKENVGKCNIF